MHQATRAGNVEIAKAILPIDICSHRRCALSNFANSYPLPPKMLYYPRSSNQRRNKESNRIHKHIEF